MRTIAIVLVAGMLLAGCTAKTPDVSSSSSTTSSAATSKATTSQASTSASTTSSPTTTTTSANNQAPVATLTADKITGTIPLNVTFKAGGSDPDGDSLTYTLKFADNTADASGTSLPADLTHQYKVAGNFTALLTVSDGTLSVNKTVLIQATGASVTVPTGDPIVWAGYGVGTPVGCLTSDSDRTLYFDFDPALAGVWHFSTTSTVPGAAILTEWWAGDAHVTDLAGSGIIPATADNVAVCGDIPTLAIDFELTLSPT